jgi:hypothetical protein
MQPQKRERSEDRSLLVQCRFASGVDGDGFALRLARGTRPPNAGRLGLGRFRFRRYRGRWCSRGRREALRQTIDLDPLRNLGLALGARGIGIAVAAGTLAPRTTLARLAVTGRILAGCILAWLIVAAGLGVVGYVFGALGRLLLGSLIAAWLLTRTIVLLTTFLLTTLLLTGAVILLARTIVLTRAVVPLAGLLLAGALVLLARAFFLAVPAILAFAALLEAVLAFLLVVHVLAEIVAARRRRALLVETAAALAQHAEIMIRELQIIFGVDAIALRLRVAREALIFFEQLGGIAAGAVVDAIATILAAGLTIARLLTATAATTAVLTIIYQLGLILQSLVAVTTPTRALPGR